MPRSGNAQPSGRSLSVEKWPPEEQKAWSRATSSRQGPFRKNGGGKTFSPATITSLEYSYGKWLGFLLVRGQLDPAEPPHDRITLQRIDDFLDHLIVSGLAYYTITTQFDGLRAALQLICPRHDFSHVTRPAGISIRKLLPMQQRALFIPDVMTNLRWAEDLFAAALTREVPAQRQIEVRDAAIIGIFATRGPRKRAMQLLRLGVHLRRGENEWLLLQDAGITKTKNTLELPIGPRVGRILDRYISVEREELLGDRRHDALWIKTNGEPLQRDGIAGMLIRRSTTRFGRVVSSHRFRASVTTTQALADSGSPLDASLILGHSPEISLKHYNRATALAASRRYDAYLTSLSNEEPLLFEFDAMDDVPNASTRMPSGRST